MVQHVIDRLARRTTSAVVLTTHMVFMLHREHPCYVLEYSSFLAATAATASDRQIRLQVEVALLLQEAIFPVVIGWASM